MFQTCKFAPPCSASAFQQHNNTHATPDRASNLYTPGHVHPQSHGGSAPNITRHTQCMHSSSTRCCLPRWTVQPCVAYICDVRCIEICPVNAAHIHTPVSINILCSHRTHIVQGIQCSMFVQCVLCKYTCPCFLTNATPTE